MGETIDRAPEQNELVAAFIAELRHWRAIAGYSQKSLAKQIGYDSSYISKVENASLSPSREFAEKADAALHAGRALVRRWKAMHDAGIGPEARAHGGSAGDPQSTPGTALVVEHEDAALSFHGGMVETHVRRLLRNVGIEPVTSYLIRISVDRFPGDPERSNRLYRKDPLTWEEINLRARCGEEPMTWRVVHDRDAFKELWLLFENSDGRFPLYQGESTWIEYIYTVPEDKWGPWWKRAIRLPTRRLSLAVILPAERQPTVWGLETSMTAEATPFRTPFTKELNGDNVAFRWSTDDPPLHARFRVEWKFKNPNVAGEEDLGMDQMSPSDKMRAAGVVQEGESILAEVARPFDLPAEAEDARRVVSELGAKMERIAQVHTFAKGMGLAAPQIGIGRAAAVVRTPEDHVITLLNPRIVGESATVNEQYEGCLSFFDVRGMVPRPDVIEVEHQDIEGNILITEFTAGVARLVAHEIDHLFGTLYRARMRLGVLPIPVAQYTGTGKRWGFPSRDH
ncbi:peptide deformylase [Allorhizocola rhizosphaerae]|uniref:peptide deformylase n=1 Tax=Allorhizocola rhizosphaerae TaxID=1872709 RepID=UPI000E3E8E9F|nr:peptide deformylase [Allorhizocola rhizosphaerae]